MFFSITDIVGSRCLTKEQGQLVFDVIHGPLNDGVVVTIDFLGVQQFAHPFFRQSIGQLLRDFPHRNLRNQLHIIGLPKYAVPALEAVIDQCVYIQEGDDAT